MNQVKFIPLLKIPHWNSVPEEYGPLFLTRSPDDSSRLRVLMAISAAVCRTSQVIPVVSTPEAVKQLTLCKVVSHNIRSTLAPLLF